MATRAMTPAEIDTLSAFFPLNLTPDQLEKILKGVQAACEVAFTCGVSTNKAFQNLYRNLSKEKKS